MKLPRKKNVEGIAEESTEEDAIIEEPIVESEPTPEPEPTPVVEEKIDATETPKEKPADTVKVKVLVRRLHCEFGTFKRDQVFECPLKRARAMIPHVKILR